MVVGGSQKVTLDLGFVLLGTRQQDVPVILRELILPDGFDSASPSFKIREVITELYGPQLNPLTEELCDTRPIESASISSLADECQVVQNLGSGFPGDCFPTPSYLNIVYAMSNHVD
ncbi:unnamed protein product [Schistosoma margrebowiei]|uniref:Uncharacterized protein n=1 Tax=Schistosoma margrebowiei TaxID=48269 RepID=A0A183MC25_9TREM|nr:unnamed protein product [Schistosoma margrebowiei]